MHPFLPVLRITRLSRTWESFVRLLLLSSRVAVIDLLYYALITMLVVEFQERCVATAGFDMARVIIGGVVLGLASLMAYIVSNLLIWSTITARRLNARLVIKYIFMCCIWHIVCLTLILGGLSVFPESAISSGLKILFWFHFHFSTVLYIGYFTQGTIRRSLGTIIPLGVLNIKKFLLLYAILLFASFTLGGMLWKLISQGGFSLIALLALISGVFAFLRVEIFEISKEALSNQTSMVSINAKLNTWIENSENSIEG